MIVDAILVGLIFYFSFPLLTGYCAMEYGRSFWVWFSIGSFLPIISFFVLAFLIFWDEKTTPSHKLNRREKLTSAEMVSELMNEMNRTTAQIPQTPKEELKQRARLLRRKEV
ncbi:MAG: hypothetical protein AAF616_13650 [Bacteroidota bacterium]